MKNEIESEIVRYNAVIERLNHQINEAENEIARIETYLIACDTVKDVFDGVERPDINPHDHYLKLKLRKDSRAYKVREALLNAKKPLHIDEIYKTIHNDNEINKSKLDSLRGNLNGMCSQLRVFVRVKPCVYGLMELGHKQEAVSL